MVLHEIGRQLRLLRKRRALVVDERLHELRRQPDQLLFLGLLLLPLASLVLLLVINFCSPAAEGWRALGVGFRPRSRLRSALAFCSSSSETSLEELAMAT